MKKSGLKQLITKIVKYGISANARYELADVLQPPTAVVAATSITIVESGT